MDRYEMTTVTLDTIMGPREIPAPAGWEYSKTDITVWNALLRYTRESRGKLKTKRDGYVIGGQIAALANVLANAKGMAGAYWEWAAKQVIDDEKRR